jgi:hypothetical protein
MASMAGAIDAKTEIMRAGFVAKDALGRTFGRPLAQLLGQPFLDDAVLAPLDATWIGDVGYDYFLECTLLGACRVRNGKNAAALAVFRASCSLDTTTWRFLNVSDAASRV